MDERKVSPPILSFTLQAPGNTIKSTTWCQQAVNKAVFACAAEAEGCPKEFSHGLVQSVEDRSQRVHAGAGRGSAAAYRVCAGRRGDQGAGEVASGYGSRAQALRSLQSTNAPATPPATPAASPQVQALIDAVEVAYQSGVTNYHAGKLQDRQGRLRSRRRPDADQQFRSADRTPAAR